MPEDPALLFVANLIHERKCREEGYACATLWLCTREDIQQECLTEARVAVADWWQHEQDVEQRRAIGAAHFEKGV